MSKPNPSATHARRKLAMAIAIAVTCAPGAGAAAPVDISTKPLASASSSLVKPNVMFSLDTSGSMLWTHAPDDAENFLNKYGYSAQQCNSMFYNPAFNYDVPKNFDGSDFPAATFTAALSNGYDAASPKVDLSRSFQAWQTIFLTNSGVSGNDTAQAAYYHRYTGTQATDFVNTGSTFYRECNSLLGSVPGRNVFTKVVVSATSGPGGTDERPNYANWYSYYRNRLNMMKSGVGHAFVNVTSNYRVGFLTIYATPSSSTTNPEYLGINDFDLTQKQTWFNRVYATKPTAGTPLRSALATVGRLYGGRLSGASSPGAVDPVQYSCQQNFLILTTDGYWNASSANPVKLDGTSLIDNQDDKLAPPMYDGGTVPNPLNSNRLTAVRNSLADAAAYYYNTDLRPASGPCTSATVPGEDVCRDNVPKSGLDDAPHQHMTTFTLGLGVNGQLKFDTDYLSGKSADYNAIKAGTKNWPYPNGDTRTAIDDLWHAAVNGHGQYFSAKNPDLLVSGLRTALAGVSAREAAGAAAATSNLEPVAGDNFAFIANYRTVKWDGDVQARFIDISTGAIADVPQWSAQKELDNMVSGAGDTRKIFTWLGGTQVDFIPASFTVAQKDLWFKPDGALSQFGDWDPILQKPFANADNLINYLRGQFGFEERAGNTALLYRKREHVLGDIINGKPVYVKTPPFNYSENGYQNDFKFSTAIKDRPGVVYVAANDGMLHAFSSTTGKELWAFIPSFVLPKLKALASADYGNQHQYLVDGSPTVSDVWNGSQWRTILVAGLNAGGKGYYAIDVTDPTLPKVLWEFTDANMGFTFGNPIVGKLANGGASPGDWVVTFASGYNNADGRGHLYVVDAMTGGSKIKFSVDTPVGVGGPANPVGLARISAWVDSGLEDNTLQRIYGGDMLGNLWRFDINDSIAPAGMEATLFASFMIGSVPQPITTKPELGLVGTRPVVFVGTGRYLGASDLSDVTQQSLYGLREDLTAAGLGDIRGSSNCAAPGKIVKQTLTVIDANRRTTSANSVDFEVDCGWALDFNPLNQTPGERINVDPKLQLGVLAVATNIPEKSACTVGGSSFIYFFDYTTGAFVSTSTGGLVGERIGNSIAVGTNTYRLPDGRVVTTVTTSDDKHPVFGNPDNPLIGATGKRVLWRELIN